MTGWTLAKYTLMLAGIALVLAADRFGLRWLGLAGLALVVLAFLLRFLQRRAAARADASREPPPE